MTLKDSEFLKILKPKRNILLNPGPATTTDSVKLSQIVPDICPREKEFGQVMRWIVEKLTEISGGNEEYTTVLFGGSGTAGVEAIISSVIPHNTEVLIINNGAYGERMVKIAKTYSIKVNEKKYPYDNIPSYEEIEKILQNNSNISTIGIVHHETTTGLLNPIKNIGELAKKYNKIYIVDAMSSFAGIPFNIKECNIDFMVSTSNKCIQGMAGCVFVICKKSSLEKLKNIPPRSFYLSLWDQYEYFEKHNQTRFTPPVQVIYALKKAIEEFLEEGAENRYKRYYENWKTLVEGMKDLGFKKLLKDEYESHILTTFFYLEDKNFSFEKMHDLLYERGFTIYPGKIGGKNTFRLANMGDIYPEDIINFIENLKEVLIKIGVKIKK